MPRHSCLLALLCALLAPPSLRAADTPPPAASILHQAEVEAARTHKHILLSFGASWCGNCHLFNRFLDDPAMHPLLTQAFVPIEIITGERPGDPRHSNSPGGLELEQRLGGKDAGWPYLAILDEHGNLVIDSFRPEDGQPHKSNIGYPASPAEIDWFTHMLEVAAPQLTPGNLAAIHAWLSEHAPRS